MKRRSFLKSIPLAYGIMALSCDKDKNEYVEQLQTTGDPLYDRFRSPKPTAKPFYRWWWNDNRVTAKEVRRELRLVSEAGAGGVEINPIALPPVYENLPGEKLAWLSSEWNDELPGRSKRMYELTSEGVELLGAWITALESTQERLAAFLQTYHEGKT